MVRLITRDEALATLTSDDDVQGCLMCAFREPRFASRIFAATPLTFSIVPRYALRPGHVLVVLRDHVTRFADASPAAWVEACVEAQRIAAVLERRRPQTRCYVASLGTNEPNVPMSSPHVHLHIVPITDPETRPSDVFTWRGGVYERDDAAIAEERAALRL